MDSDFCQLTMEDVVTEFRGGDSFTKMEYKKSGIPVLTKGDIKPYGRVSFNGERYIDPVDQMAKGYKLTSKGDFILTTRDLTTAANFLGLLSPVPDPYFYLVNQGANVLRFNNEVDARYLIYWTHSSDYRWHIKNHAVGSTQIHLRKGDFLSAPLRLPSIRVQREIAHILGALDDKIELNRKTNETLEGIAKALFKSWFVDFDPVRAKAEERSTGLPDEISELFPDSFEESELGEIPSGWRVVSLGNMCSKIGSGQTPRGGKEAYKGGDFALIRSQNIYNNGFAPDGLVNIDDNQAKQLSNAEVLDGDVLINITGDSVARTCLAPSSLLPARVNQHVAIVRADNRYARSSYLRFLLVSPEIQGLLLTLASGGATRDALTKSMLQNLQITVPPLTVMDEFHALAGGFLDKQSCSYVQTLNLECLRDALLPRLISGELRVPDAEKMLKEVGI